MGWKMAYNVLGIGSDVTGIDEKTEKYIFPYSVSRMYLIKISV